MRRFPPRARPILPVSVQLLSEMKQAFEKLREDVGQVRFLP